MINLNRLIAYLAAVIIVSMQSAPGGHAQSVSASSRRPNIIFLFADDQPATCTGYAGNKAIKTPHLDALAQRGMVFSNTFVTTAICCSNRASILTGQAMRGHGITDFRTPLSKEAFAQTYPAILRRAGYRTGYLGKFAVGNPELHPIELALPASEFDFWYGFPQSISYRQTVEGKPRYLTQLMTEKAIEFLESDDERPFCLTVAFKEPHGPFNYLDPNVSDSYANIELPVSPTFTVANFESQPEFIRKSLGGSGSRRLLKNPEEYQAELRTFYRAVTRADQALGEILAALKRLRLEEDTVVIYSSDHGSLLGDHGLTGKWLMYENSIRVPLIIYDPRFHHVIENARSESARALPRQCDELALSIDLAPTILSLAGVPLPDRMDGCDLMPLVRKESISWRSHFYYEHIYTPEDMKRAPIPRTEGIRTARWKYVRFPDHQPVYEQLFDLRSDPLEQDNVIEKHTATEFVDELRTLCDAGP